MQHHFTSLRDARTFALAGNATITLSSLRSGAHFTFKVREKDSTNGGGSVHFVSLLRDGSADEGSFTYLGMIREGRFALTKSSRVSADAPSFKAFAYFWNVPGEQIPALLEVRHEMKCGRCGRTLTVPSSIDSGLGPECRQLMGLE
jgi:hypothetical protein